MPQVRPRDITIPKTYWRKKTIPALMRVVDIVDEYDLGKYGPIVCKLPKHTKLLFFWLKRKVHR